jgi:3-hydroxyisobutyrate dehydrogenase-like beta-hydroxyacid dehydrogenase
MSRRVAFLGTGLMGAPMARRLLAAGHEVTVWNRTRPKSEALADAGAAVADTSDAATANAEVVVTMVSDAAAVEAVLLCAPGGTFLEGRTVLQMSTIGPDESRDLARRVANAGGEWLEAPVLGSVPQATDGTLLIMAGCEPSLYERWLPVLEAMGRPRLVGPVGHAATLKLAMNQLIASITGAYASSLGLVRRAGVDVDAFADTVRASALYAPTFDKKLANMLAHEFEPANFPARHLLKDVRLFEVAGAALGLDTTFVDGIRRVLEATLDRGLADADYSALAASIDPPG